MKGADLIFYGAVFHFTFVMLLFIPYAFIFPLMPSFPFNHLKNFSSGELIAHFIPDYSQKKSDLMKHCTYLGTSSICYQNENIFLLADHLKSLCEICV